MTATIFRFRIARVIDGITLHAWHVGTVATIPHGWAYTTREPLREAPAANDGATRVEGCA
jgi:hypothetical protein